MSGYKGIGVLMCFIIYSTADSTKRSFFEELWLTIEMFRPFYGPLVSYSKKLEHIPEILYALESPFLIKYHNLKEAQALPK